MLRVGLTGGIATGKTYVRRRMSESGLPTLDLDTLVHEVMGPGGDAVAAVVQAFGGEVQAVDGGIDRRALGRRVFADADARRLLERIVHPLLRGQEERWVARMRAQGHALAVVDAALLVEAGLHTRFDRLVVTHCPQAVQLERLRARDAVDEEEARRRLAAQMPAKDKRRFAHFEIDTSGSFDHTDRATAVTIDGLRSAAASAPSPPRHLAQAALWSVASGPTDGPRGLSPVGLLDEIVRTGGLEMERVALLLHPPCPEPWYQCARADQAGPGPEVLAAPLVAWTLARRGHDADFLATATFSMARLTHGSAEEVAGACLVARALLETIVGQGPGPFLAERLPEWEAAAARRVGAPPHPRARRLVREAAAAQPAPPGTMAGAFTAAASGAASAPLPAELAAALERMAGGGLP